MDVDAPDATVELGSTSEVYPNVSGAPPSFAAVYIMDDTGILAMAAVRISDLPTARAIASDGDAASSARGGEPPPVGEPLALTIEWADDPATAVAVPLHDVDFNSLRYESLLARGVISHAALPLRGADTEDGDAAAAANLLFRRRMVLRAYLVLAAGIGVMVFWCVYSLLANVCSPLTKMSRHCTQ